MMKNNESKVILGLTISALLGASLLCYLKNRNRPPPVLQKIGKTMAELGNMLEHCNLSNASDQLADKIEKNIPKGSDFLSHLMDWADSGLSFWKKLTK